MIKIGIAYNVINNETLQIEDLDNGELYEVKGENLTLMIFVKNLKMV